MTNMSNNSLEKPAARVSILVRGLASGCRFESLQELVARIPKNYNREEVEWGEPVGRENW